MWVRSSTQNINVAIKQNWVLKERICTEEILLFNNVYELAKYQIHKLNRCEKVRHFVMG